MTDPLTPEEIRVLGALVEKELSTPDYYPMTVNALVQACNQKTNREPVVQYDEAVVQEALEALQRRRLAGTASGASMRALKYRHTLAEALGLGVPERAVLAVLMLRGPQTVGEIRGRTGRMAAFDTLEAVEAVLADLAGRDEPLVMELERRPGQKEARFMHRLGGPPEVAEPVPPAPTRPEAGSEADAERLQALEDEVQALRRELDGLRAAFDAFRTQFE
ncbi:MAG: DUF480 domain-containing protein [Bacteroidetes bacterium]|nr:MAG: DUF480 domain-containing protein [Bacteroidota bacterium]